MPFERFLILASIFTSVPSRKPLAFSWLKLGWMLVSSANSSRTLRKRGRLATSEMKATFCISRARFSNGSSPRTRTVPS